MPTNGDFDGLFSNIGNVPIFTYGMITATALVLSYMTFMDQGIQTDEEAAEALGESSITNSLGYISPSINDSISSTANTAGIDTTFLTPTPNTTTETNFLEPSTETNFLEPSTETPLGIETSFNTQPTTESLEQFSQDRPIQNQYELQPTDYDSEDRISSERYSTGGKKNSKSNYKAKKKTTRKKT
jgi:hypothetical protein